MTWPWVVTAAEASSEAAASLQGQRSSEARGAAQEGARKGLLLGKQTQSLIWAKK